MQNPIARIAPTRRECALSILVMAILLVILASVMVLQHHYDLARWRAQPQNESNGSVHGDNGAADVIPTGLTPLAPAERYEPANLSDKIDGKAELYLSAGFQGLQTRRFALQGNPQQWMERYVYDMGGFRNAFAVFSGQRRPGSQALALADEGYLAANGLFLVQGRYYLEIIASQLSPALQDGMKALARAFVQAHPGSTETLASTRRFPPQGQVPHTIALIPANAFGLDQLDWVYTAQYQWGAAQATAFVSPRASAEEAQRLVRACRQYFLDYGGQNLDVAGLPQGSGAIAILDSYEIIFAYGNYLAGVHEATDLEHAVKLATDLLRILQEAGNGS